LSVTHNVNTITPAVATVARKLWVFDQTFHLDSAIASPPRRVTAFFATVLLAHSATDDTDLTTAPAR